MSTAPLYELGAELQELIDRIIDADGEIDQETEMLLDRVQLQFDEKVEKCVLAIRAYKARAEMIHNEMQRLQDMERTQATAAASLKAYVENIMRRHSIRKAGGALGKAYFARNPMRVVLPPEFDPRELPEQYQKITVEPRKKEMLEAHKRGEELPPYVEIVQSESLRVK